MVAAKPAPESVVRAAAAVHAQAQAQADSSATLAEIVCQARRCLPEFEHVSVSRIHPDDTLETLVAGTDLARAFDAAQSSARQGSCIDATDDIVVVRDAPHEQRWPAYISQATKLGLLSQIGVRLRSDAHGVICLNLHSTTHPDIDAGSVGVAEHFGVHAGLALGHVLSPDPPMNPVWWVWGDVGMALVGCEIATRKGPVDPDLAAHLRDESPRLHGHELDRRGRAATRSRAGGSQRGRCEEAGTPARPVHGQLGVRRPC